MWKAQQYKGNLAGGSQPTHSPIEIGDANDDGTKIQINQEPIFDFGFHDEEEVQSQCQIEDFDMLFEDEESSGSQHSTSKLNQNKKKKVAISRK